MIRYALKRLLTGAICLIGISIIIFAAVRVTGDGVLLLLTEDATERIMRSSMLNILNSEYIGDGVGVLRLS